MRTIPRLAFLVAAVGCGSSPPPLNPRAHGYADRMEAADVHEQRADQHRGSIGHADVATRVENYQCGDRNDMSDQLTSGGKPLMPMVPCWDPVEDSARHERSAARVEQHRARVLRRSAAELVETELAECRGISPQERGHSPFAHRTAIAEVIPHHAGKSIRGVRIILRPVPGLTQQWLEQAIACHRAEYERQGEPTTFLSDDPTLVPGATATVSAHRGHLEVLVETRNDVAAQVALGRARDLIAPRTADR
jgi:hypothetical protein